MNFRNSLILLCLAGAVAPAEMHFSGPAAGFVFHEPARAVVRIAGVPGAWYLADPAIPDVDFALPAPDSAKALAVRGGALSLVRGFERPELEWVALGTADAKKVVAAWNRDSSSAAVYSAVQHTLRIYHGLDSVPVLGAEADLAELPGQVTALALDGPARQVFMAVRHEVAGGIYLLDAARAPKRLAALRSPAGLAVSSSGSQVFTADGTNVLRVEAEAGIFHAEEGEVAGIAYSRDGRRLIVALRSNRAALIDIASGDTERIDLDFAPSGITRLGDGSLFLLNPDGTDSPLQVLQEGPPARVYFIPAGPAGGAQ